MTLYFDACTFAVLTCQRSGPKYCSVAAEDFSVPFVRGCPLKSRRNILLKLFRSDADQGRTEERTEMYTDVHRGSTGGTAEGMRRTNKFLKEKRWEFPAIKAHKMPASRWFSY